jgi:hypothetical protein
MDKEIGYVSVDRQVFAAVEKTYRLAYGFAESGKEPHPPNDG